MDALRDAIEPLLANPLELCGAIADRLRSAGPSAGSADLFEEIGEEIAPLITHEHALLARHAAEVLELAPSEEGLAMLLAVARGEEPVAAPDVRAAAAAVVVLRGGHEDLVLDLLDEEDDGLRRAVWLGLATGGEEARSESFRQAVVERAFAETHFSVTEPALTVAAAFGAPAGRVLDALADSEDELLQPMGVLQGLRNAGTTVTEADVRARLPGAGPVSRWRLVQVLDGLGAATVADVEPLIADGLPADVRIEAAGWLSDRRDRRGDDVLAALCDEGPTLQRIRAAAERLRVRDYDALLLLLPHVFGPYAARPAVRSALESVDERALRRLKIYVARAANNPPAGAGTIALLRRLSVEPFVEALVDAIAADASDDLTRVALAGLFDVRAEEAAELLERALNARTPAGRAVFAAGFDGLWAPAPAALVDQLLRRPEAGVVTVAVELTASLPRADAVARLRRVLAAEVERLRQDTPAREDLGTAALAGDPDFVVTLRGALEPILQPLGDDRVAAFQVLDEQGWADPSGMITAAIAGVAMRRGLSELAPGLDELSARTPTAVRLRAILALRVLAPWRLDGREFAPDPDGLLRAVSRLRVG